MNDQINLKHLEPGVTPTAAEYETYEAYCGARRATGHQVIPRKLWDALKKRQAERAAEKAPPVTVTVIDMTPTWEENARACLALVEAGDAKGRDFGRKEIIRMGQILDEIKRVREGK